MIDATPLYLSGPHRWGETSGTWYMALLNKLRSPAPNSGHTGDGYFIFRMGWRVLFLWGTQTQRLRYNVSLYTGEIVLFNHQKCSSRMRLFWNSGGDKMWDGVFWSGDKLEMQENGQKQILLNLGTNGHKSHPCYCITVVVRSSVRIEGDSVGFRFCHCLSH